ncbi:MAG: leucine-rich repeat protein [Prevotella sp.]|nr:leucine-rich repeat protein [Prevotella sp.]
MKQFRLLSLMILALLMPRTVQADQLFTYEGVTYNIPSGYYYVEVAPSASGHYTGTMTIPGYVIYNNTWYLVRNVMPEAFKNCTGLKKVVLPEGLYSIGDEAFAGCTSLKSITIPSTVEIIGNLCFAGCVSDGKQVLKTIAIRRLDPPRTRGYVVNDEEYKDITLRVREASIDAYLHSGDPNWDKFSAIEKVEGEKTTYLFDNWIRNSDKTETLSGMLVPEGDQEKLWQLETWYNPNASISKTTYLGEQAFQLNATFDKQVQIDITSQFPVTGTVQAVIVRAAIDEDYTGVHVIAMDWDNYSTIVENASATDMTRSAEYKDYIIWLDDVEMTKARLKLTIVTHTSPIYIQSISIVMAREEDLGGFPVYEGDEGTQAKPYQIKNADDMTLLAKCVNRGQTFRNKYFALANDIDFGGGKQNNYTPVGKYSSSYAEQKPFLGTFDGQGHTISGIYLEDNAENACPALFSIIGNYDAGGAVKNLTVAKSTFSGYKYVATFVGYASNEHSLVENCHALSSVTIKCNYGNGAGIVAGNSVAVRGCTNEATVEGNYNWYYSGISNNYNIQDCLNLGAVIGERQRGAISCYNNNIYLKNNYYAGACNIAGVMGHDMPGAQKANVSTTAPDYLGAKVKEYTSYAGAPGIVAYENGLYYDGKYYASDVKPTQQFPIYSGDDGSEANPFQIKMKEDLNKLAQDIASGTLYDNMKFVLTADLDYGGGTETNFTPVGNSCFSLRGVFDGQGHTISGIVINRTGDYDADSYVGLFGKVTYIKAKEYTVVKNLTLANSTIKGSDYVGGIAGYFSGGLMENCHVLGNVNVETDWYGGNIGGVVGQIGANMSGCTSECTVTKTGRKGGFIGGIIGQYTGATPNYEMKDCLGLATLSGDGLSTTSTGALVGTNSSTIFTNNYYVGPSTILGVKCKDVDGARRAVATVDIPDGIGAQSTVYTSFANAPGLTAYENGLLFMGKYYTAYGEVKPGDVSGDAKYDAVDIVTLVRILLGVEKDPLGVADVNGDGKTNVSDLIMLILFIYR